MILNLFCAIFENDTANLTVIMIKNLLQIIQRFTFFSACLLVYVTPSAAQVNHSNAFIENKGQIINQDFTPNEDVLFLYTGKGVKIQLRKTGYSYEIFTLKNLPTLSQDAGHLAFLEQLKQTQLQNYRVDIDFKDMNQQPLVETDGQINSYLNYFVSGQEAIHVRSFNRITYKNVYDNTDIEFVINQNDKNPLKYNIILHPGADLNKIKFLIKGAQSVKADKNRLIIQTPLGSIYEKIPFSYYTDAPTVNQPVAFNIDDQNTLTFKASYDSRKTLVIDPSSNLIWSTYYSGQYLDYCKSTRVDAQHNVYIAGYTSSSNNIATNNSFQSSMNGVLDGYVAKFNPSGQCVWATYFGGSSVEQILAMHITSDNFIYVVGDTFSTSNITTPGVHQTVYGGGQDDMMIVKFDTNGQRIWSTYLGGSEHEFAQAVCTDVDGNIVIAGHTTSSNAMATAGAFRTSYNFSEDGYIAKLTSNGALVWGTYYNDSGDEVVHSVSCDSDKNVYATGITNSIAGMGTPGSHQANLSGASDGFLAKFSANGNNLLWATYYGGTNNDEGTAVRVGQNGLIYLSGNTSSNNNISSPGANQPNISSAEDGFLACFNPAGIRQWGTYFGGSGTDYINDMVLDANGNLVFCGQTLSTNSISSTGAYQASLSAVNTYDAYFARFSNTGQPKLATYFGLANNDIARSVCVDVSGKVYLAGETTSTVGLATTAAHQTVALGNGDCFLAKFCMDIEPIISPANTTLCIGPTTVSTAEYATYLWSNGSTINPMPVGTTSIISIHYFTVYVTDGFGCTGSSGTYTFATKHCGVSVGEYENTNALKVYPIPSSDKLQITLEDDNADFYQLEVFSITGQKIITLQKTENTHSIDIKHLNNGIYILRAVINGKDYYTKFIKE